MVALLHKICNYDKRGILFEERMSMENKSEILLFQILILIILCFFTYIGIKNHIVIGTIIFALMTILWTVFTIIGVIEGIFKR